MSEATVTTSAPASGFRRWARCLSALSIVALSLGAGSASAAPKAKAKAAPAAKAKKGAEKEKPKEQEQDRADEAPADASSPKAAEPGNVKVQEDKEGVRTYKFETVEVEGRLKSPQVIYFLRRVRAEFEAGALGHRSFLGELSDSRRSAAFR